MAFGVTATTVPQSPASARPASAAVHIGEVGTTAASGTAHWKLGNVHWPTSPCVPGAIGAFLGRRCSPDSTAAAEPVVTSLLLLLDCGCSSARSSSPAPSRRRRRRKKSSGTPRAGRLAPASGWVFWGSRAIPGRQRWRRMGAHDHLHILTVRKTQPRKVIGTVSASEFLVSISASVGFISLGPQFLSLWQPVAACWSAV